jgi:phage terminase large subunit
MHDKRRFIDKVFEKMHNKCIGVDFGYNDPTTLILYGEYEGEHYAQEILYETCLTNTQLIHKIKNFDTRWIADIKDLEFICDSAEPARIEEMCQAGINAKPANKMAGSILQGINLIKSKTLNITKDSLNLLKEIETYKWKEDKEGNPLDEPIDDFNHCIDALRYAVFTKNSGKHHNTEKPVVVVGGYNFYPD